MQTSNKSAKNKVRILAAVILPHPGLRKATQIENVAFVQNKFLNEQEPISCTVQVWASWLRHECYFLVVLCNIVVVSQRNVVELRRVVCFLRFSSITCFFNLVPRSQLYQPRSHSLGGNSGERVVAMLDCEREGERGCSCTN